MNAAKGKGRNMYGREGRRCAGSVRLAPNPTVSPQTACDMLNRHAMAAPRYRVERQRRSNRVLVRHSTADQRLYFITTAKRKLPAEAMRSARSAIQAGGVGHYPPSPAHPANAFINIQENHTRSFHFNQPAHSWNGRANHSRRYVQQVPPIEDERSRHRIWRRENGKQRMPSTARQPAPRSASARVLQPALSSQAGTC